MISCVSAVIFVWLFERIAHKIAKESNEYFEANKKSEGNVKQQNACWKDKKGYLNGLFISVESNAS